MKCKVCGAQIPNDARVCPYCDSEIERKEETGRSDKTQGSDREREAVERLKQSLKARQETLAEAEVRSSEIRPSEARSDTMSDTEPVGKKKKSMTGPAVFAMLALGILAVAGNRHMSATGSGSSSYRQVQETNGSNGRSTGADTAKSDASGDFSGYWEAYYSGAGSHTGLNIGLYGDTYDLTAWTYFDRRSAKEMMTASVVDGQLVYTDGMLVSYLRGENGTEASITQYYNGSGYFALCPAQEVSRYMGDAFSDRYVTLFAREWEGTGDDAHSKGDTPYLVWVEDIPEYFASQEYVIWYSSQIELTEGDVAYLSDEQRRIARNEIYARHGRKFNSADLQQHFNACTWYYGTIEPSQFSEDLLTAVEKHNVSLLQDN